MKNDVAVGLLALLFAGLYFYLASDISHSFLADPVGAAGLPKTYAIALGLLAALLIVRTLVAAAARSEAAGTDSHSPAVGRHFRALGLLVPGVAYLLFISTLGYFLTIFLLIIAVALYAGAKFNFQLISISAAGGILMWIVFVKLFSIPLPTGTLWQGLI
ncbi:MAG: tripartite tricarboxylate transporter TctB family protein [Burkholderiales bacterium]|nr:tripartite tricarboxylate transporter TctB family protein [Burkholderiales bacterium]